MRDLESTEPRTRVVTPLKHPVPDPKVSFARHPEILRAFVVVSNQGKEPVSYKDVGKVTVAPSKVSGNTKFFEHVGFIRKVQGSAGKYLPTSDAIDIVKDLSWNKVAEAKVKTARLLQDAWFWQAVREFLSVKNRASESELIQHLGREVGADPRKHLSSLKVMISYLRDCQLLDERDGFLVIGANSNSAVHTSPALNAGSYAAQTNPDSTSLQSEPHDPSRIGPSILFGVLMTPDMTDSQIRRVVRTVLDEIRNNGGRSE